MRDLAERGALGRPCTIEESVEGGEDKAVSEGHRFEVFQFPTASPFSHVYGADSPVQWESIAMSGRFIQQHGDLTKVGPLGCYRMPPSGTESHGMTGQMPRPCLPKNETNGMAAGATATTATAAATPDDDDDDKDDWGRLLPLRQTPMQSLSAEQSSRLAGGQHFVEGADVILSGGRTTAGGDAGTLHHMPPVISTPVHMVAVVAN